MVTMIVIMSMVTMEYCNYGSKLTMEYGNYGSKYKYGNHMEYVNHIVW